MANELHTLSIGGTNYPIRPFKMTVEGDNRSVSTAPSDYVNEFIFKGLKYNNQIGSPSSATYSYLFGLRGWSDNSGGNAHEIAFNDNGLYRRQGASTEWGAWAQILDSSNYTSYLNIAPVLQYHGITTTALTDGATTNPIKLNGKDHTPETGCVVFYGNKEYIWNGSAWEEFGYPFALNVAKTTLLGGVKPWFYSTLASTGTVTNLTRKADVNLVSSVDGRYYGVEMDVNGRMYVNVPWKDSMINVTYEDLKVFRNSGSFIPGQQYRIIDYTTTTTQENTISANHQFDIIVTADSENSLNEKARACLHEGDVYFSNVNAKLEAWQIWYCLDNDTNRFYWADENGKGVIYRMIDEWGNDCPYDFKNIIFRNKIIPDTSITTDAYTFTWVDEDYNVIDASVFGNDGSTLTYYGGIFGVHNNVIKPYMSSGAQCALKLNDITFISDTSYEESGNDGFLGCYNNSFGYDCYGNSFGNNCNNNSFGNNLRDNSFGYDCYNNSFGDNCYNNSFGDNCYNNLFVIDEFRIALFGDYSSGQEIGEFEEISEVNETGEIIEDNTNETGA